MQVNSFKPNTYKQSQSPSFGISTSKIRQAADKATKLGKYDQAERLNVNAGLRETLAKYGFSPKGIIKTINMINKKIESYIKK